MKRAQEKIKDLVEPGTFTEVLNFVDDPARALSSYFFTDATSDLFARWLDELADLPRNQGTARALAGLRGVGKSHTLAAFGALAALPELRHTVKDLHVATSAGRLIKRPYKVAHVERGTRPTLHEELSAALGGDEETWKAEPSKMLSFAASLSDTPLLLIIDTAHDREARVERDDGALLSELAAAAKIQNIFLALALDDDIAGADGANVSLSGSFKIDYLDPEHLYKITDTHLFQKDEQARAALKDMYRQLRSSVPGFNWSEPRFAAIYPMHPLIADVASAVRLYVPSFAFLPFAAAAGAHAGSRPALSLVVLDELFDRTEKQLRRSPRLADAFAAYDHLALRAVSHVPVMQRLQAKLILKGLFVLSLDGRGATAKELGAAMLLYDDQHPTAGIERIENVLSIFAQAAPAGSLLRDEGAGEALYRFNIAAPSDSGHAEEGSAEATESPAARRETGRALYLGDEDLARWATLLTGRELPASLQEAGAQATARAALNEWLTNWRADNPLKHFDALPDEGVTTRVWNLASAVRKGFGEAAISVEAALQKTITLEECLQSVADAFNDSPDRLERVRGQMRQLASFLEELPARTRAREYLALAEPTGVDEIESARRELLAIAGDVHSLFDAESVNRFNLLWHEFHARYTEVYAALHDEALRDDERRRRVEELARADEWREFEALAQLQIVNRRYWEEATEILERASAASCRLPVRQLLAERPLCACRFRLTSSDTLSRVAEELLEVQERGRAAYRRTLDFLSTPLAIALDALARNEPEAEQAARARSLSGAFAQGRCPAQISPADVRLIERALNRMSAPPPVRLSLPVSDYGLLTRDELRARLNQWLDDLPNEPAVVEFVGAQDGDAG